MIGNVCSFPVCILALWWQLIRSLNHGHLWLIMELPIEHLKQPFKHFRLLVQRFILLRFHFQPRVERFIQLVLVLVNLRVHRFLFLLGCFFRKIWVAPQLKFVSEPLVEGFCNGKAIWYFWPSLVIRFQTALELPEVKIPRGLCFQGLAIVRGSLKSLILDVGVQDIKHVGNRPLLVFIPLILYIGQQNITSRAGFYHLLLPFTPYQL